MEDTLCFHKHLQLPDYFVISSESILYPLNFLLWNVLNWRAALTVI